MTAVSGTPEAFVIMQIGNPELDQIYETVIAPAIVSAGFIPRRVDLHNEGDILKSEIVAYIERCDIIIGDITNARPNCYLEVGYAMGIGKKKNLILTVREDHHHSSPNYVKGGPRVHFDLEGYDLLFWDPDDLPKFRNELEQRISRRYAIVRRNKPGNTPPGPLTPVIDEELLNVHRSVATTGLSNAGFTGYLEAFSAIEPKGTWTQAELLEAVEASEIRTFGWPIGLVLPQDEYRPLPTAGGIRAEISFPDRDSYDYWIMQRTGAFYMLRSLFEDKRSPNHPVIYANTRIVQITELLLFLSRLYARLNVSKSTSVGVWTTHGGIQGRVITAIGNMGILSWFPKRPCVESQITTNILTTVGELENNLEELVKALVAPLFTLFDFHQVSDATLHEIVEHFVSGEVI